MTHKSNFQILPILAVLGLILAILGLASSLVTIVGRRNILKNRQEELARLKVQNEKLQKKLTEVETPQFVEKEAREKLNMAKPEETIVLVDQTEPTVHNAFPAPNQIPNWKKWWNLFF